MMQTYEYKVIPAPNRGIKERGLKTGAERFAYAISVAMNELAVDGWEYWRAESLAAEERSGLTSKTMVTHSLLVFRRPTEAAKLAATQPGVTAFEQRGNMLSAFSPVGRAPRLGPAADDENK